MTKKIHLAVIGLAFIVLNGCTTLPQSETLAGECRTSRVLITDLTQNTAAHRAMLPSGEQCPSETL